MALAIGSQLGGYDIVASLGRGGMGEVYRAADASLGRDVALKVLPQHQSASPEQRERFVREARAASALNHPNIITIYEIGSDQGVDFIAMELVRGRTLTEALSDHRTTIPELLGYALQIAEGLSRAHGAGIVHRDLKPTNIMVTDDRLIKILDFGVAKMNVDTDAADLQTQAPLTRDGASVGTVGYMSPEQALGAPVDARTDVFSFGIILFELLTKQRPFVGASASDVLHSLHFAEPPIARIPSSVPRPVVAVIRKCLAKSPQDRYRTMTDVAEVLRTLTVQDAGAARQSWTAATLTAVRDAARSSRGRALLIGLAALVAVGASIRYIPLRSSSAGSPTAPAESLPSSALELTTMAATHLVRQDRPEDVERAITLLERAIQIDPSYAPAYAHLSEARLRTYRTSPDKQWLKLAGDSANRAVALNPDLAIGHVALGFFHHDSGQTDAALGAFRRAAELDPLNPLPQMGIGATLATARRDAEAEAALRRAIELGPNRWRAHTELGQFFYVRARYAEAVESWEKARALTPDNLIVLRNLGAAYFRSRHYDEAASVLQRALEVGPSGGILANLGNIYFVQGRYSDSVASFERALQLDANNYLYWGNLGDALRWAPGRRPEAASAYRHASELLRTEIAAKPADAELRTRHALYLVKSGETAAALAELQTARATTFTAQMHYRATVVYELAEKRDDALEALGRALKAGYPAVELFAEPELTSLRSDPRYHRLVTVQP